MEEVPVIGVIMRPAAIVPECDYVFRDGDWSYTIHVKPNYSAKVTSYEEDGRLACVALFTPQQTAKLLGMIAKRRDVNGITYPACSDEFYHYFYSLLLWDAEQI